MAWYLVERYLTADVAADIAGLAVHADDGARRAPSEVRHVTSIAVAADETCFSLYEARTLEAVAEANALAGLAYDRIIEAAVAGMPAAVGAGGRR